MIVGLIQPICEGKVAFGEVGKIVGVGCHGASSVAHVTTVAKA